MLAKADISVKYNTMKRNKITKDLNMDGRYYS